MFPAFSPLTHSPLAQSPLSQHFPSSSLLSPSPSSYHSSSASSREDLPTSRQDIKPVAPRPRYGLLPHLATTISGDSGVSSSSPAPSSPLLSPQVAAPLQSDSSKLFFLSLVPADSLFLYFHLSIQIAGI